MLWQLQRVKKIAGYVEVEYEFYLKNFGRCDVGNFEKPLSDILVKAGCIDDDRYIIKMTLTKHRSKVDYIIIKIYEK